MNISFRLGRSNDDDDDDDRVHAGPQIFENIRSIGLSSSYNNATLCSAIMSSSKRPFRLNNFQSNARGGGKLFLNCIGHRNAVSRFNRFVKGRRCVPVAFAHLSHSTFSSSSSSASGIDRRFFHCRRRRLVFWRVPVSPLLRAPRTRRLSFFFSLSRHGSECGLALSTGLDEVAVVVVVRSSSSICRRHHRVLVARALPSRAPTRRHDTRGDAHTSVELERSKIQKAFFLFFV